MSILLFQEQHKWLRQDFELPSIETLTRLTLKVKSVDNETYLKTVFKNLKDDRQKTCILVLDEIYVKSMLTYAMFLFEQTNAFLSSIKLAGGNVVATILDGNHVNQAFFKMFDTISPWRKKEGMFLLLDFVHLMKNIRNGWITEETQEIEFCVRRCKECCKME